MGNIEKWIQETVGEASDREIAKLAGIGQSTLSRQRREGTVTVETAVKIARAFQVSVIPALLAMKVVSEEDIRLFTADVALQDATDESLAAEVLRRMKAGSELMAQPISEVERKLSAVHSVTPDNSKFEQMGTPDVDAKQYDEDAILDGINAGTEKFAAQEATDPLEENYT